MGMMLHRHFEAARVNPQDAPVTVGEASPTEAALPKTETVAEGTDVPVKATRTRKKRT